MLGLAAALQYVYCDDGKYYSLSKDNCFDPVQCRSHGGFAYSAAGVCSDLYLPASGGPTHSGDQVYACPTGQYMVYKSNKTTCTSDVTKCAGLYIIQNPMTCIDEPFYCYEYYKKRAYADSTKKVCIDWNVCYDDYEGFNDWYKCVTALQCKDDDGFAYLYPDERACIKTEPEEGNDFDPTYKQRHIYKCPDYFDLTGDKIGCIASTQCR